MFHCGYARCGFVETLDEAAYAIDKSQYFLPTACNSQYFIFAIIEKKYTLWQILKQHTSHFCSSLVRARFTCPRLRLRIWSRETGSAVPSRVSLLISILRLNRVLTYGVPLDCRGGVHLFISTATRHRVSPEFIRSRNCVRVAFTAESPPAQGQ